MRNLFPESNLEILEYIYEIGFLSRRHTRFQDIYNVYFHVVYKVSGYVWQSGNLISLGSVKVYSMRKHFVVYVLTVSHYTETLAFVLQIWSVSNLRIL